MALFDHCILLHLIYKASKATGRNNKPYSGGNKPYSVDRSKAQAVEVSGCYIEVRIYRRKKRVESHWSGLGFFSFPFVSIVCVCICVCE